MKKQNNIKCIIYSDLSDNLFEEWETFWMDNKSECIFNSPGWFISARKAFGYKKIRIVAVRDEKNGQLLGLIPLVSLRLYGINLYTLPAIEFIDHFSLLMTGQGAIPRKLLEGLLSLGLVYIPGILEEDANLLSSQGSSSFFILDDNPYIKMCNEFDIVLKNRNKKSRHIKRAMKRFGSVELVMANIDKHIALDNAIMIEKNSSKSKKGKNTFDEKKNQIFFKELVEKIGDNLFIASLLFSQEPIAYNIGFVCNNVYACSQKAHIEKYNKYRPGEVMFLKFLEIAVQNNPIEIDIGRGIDSFKMGYANAIRKLYGVVVSRSVLRRFYFISIHKIRDRLYKLIGSNVFLYTFYKSIKKTIFFH